jgi:hypothetical protein
MTLKSILTLLLVILVAVSCNQNPLDVDASKVKLKIGFVNMDSILFQASSSGLITAHQEFKKNIPEIYDYALGYCLHIGEVEDTTFVHSMQLFFADPYIARLEKRIQEKFPNLEKQKNEIKSGFQHLKYHIPSGKIPENVVFMNSFFASNAFSTEKQIGIGLERYLGKQTDVIQELPPDQFYEWIKSGMEAEFLTRDALCSWIMTHYVDEVDGNLTENIIRWGKILYLTQAAFPEASEAWIMRYSEDKYQWAMDNEYEIWKYLADQKMLFKIDDRNKMNLLNEGPYTVGLPEKGPDRLGQFIGFRMLQKYMEIKKISVEQLIQTPYTEILVEYQID